METPHSLRLGLQGKELDARHKRTGLKKPDMVRAALAEMFATHNDEELLLSIVRFLAKESRTAGARRQARKA